MPELVYLHNMGVHRIHTKWGLVKQLRIDHVALTFCQFDDALEVFSSLLYNQIAWKQGSYVNFFFSMHYCLCQPLLESIFCTHGDFCLQVP
jgi:hypothetical protein